jgi:plastocyanin
MQSPVLRLSIACGLLILTLSACGSDSPSSPTSTTSTINIVGQNGSRSFSPNPADVGGKVVVFKNSDATTHHIVSNDGTIDFGNIAPGASGHEVTMPAEGTNYHCSIHPNMIGAVNPQGGGAPPPCTGLYCEPQQ